MRKATEPTYKLHIPLADDDYERLRGVMVLIVLLDNAVSGGGASKTDSIELTQEGLGIFLGNLSDTLRDVLGRCDAGRARWGELMAV